MSRTTLQLRDAQSGELKREYRRKGASLPDRITILPDERRIVYTDGEGLLRICNLETGKFHKWDAAPAPTGKAPGQDGNRIIPDDTSIKHDRVFALLLHDLQNNHAPREFRPQIFQTYPFAIDYAVDEAGATLFALTSRARLMAWKLADGLGLFDKDIDEGDMPNVRVWSLPEGLYTLRVVPLMISRWDPCTGEPLDEQEIAPYADGYALSPDGRLILWWKSNQVALHEIGSGDSLASFTVQKKLNAGALTNAGTAALGDVTGRVFCLRLRR